MPSPTTIGTAAKAVAERERRPSVDPRRDTAWLPHVAGAVHRRAAEAATRPLDMLRQVTVNLQDSWVITPGGEQHLFEIAADDQNMLMEGLDAIAVTMKRDDEILAFQVRDRLRRPWIYL